MYRLSDIKNDDGEFMYLEISKEEMEGHCRALWLLNGGETEEWNGDCCRCEYIQGNLNCKLNPF